MIAAFAAQLVAAGAPPSPLDAASDPGLPVVQGQLRTHWVDDQAVLLPRGPGLGESGHGRLDHAVRDAIGGRCQMARSVGTTRWNDVWTAR